MIDILFSESAGGSLKAGQKKMQKSIFVFELALDIGDISNDDFAENRQKTVYSLLNPHTTVPARISFDATARLQKKLDGVRKQVLRGEDIRIWYSNKPNELCGMYWFMAELEHLEGHLNTVSIIKLPEYEYRDPHTIISYVAWKEVCCDEWQNYMALAEPTTFVFRRSCASYCKHLVSIAITLLLLQLPGCYCKHLIAIANTRLPIRPMRRSTLR